MTESSTIALLKQVSSGKLKSDKAKILNYIIKYRTATILSLDGAFSGMKLQTITPRLSELESAGLIYISRTTFLNGYNYSVYEYEYDVDKQKERALNQLKIKFEQLKNRSKKFKSVMSEKEIEFFFGNNK